jgi:hypothetical protein
MVWVPENITGKFSGDVADAGSRPSGLAAPTAQSGGQPTDWVFYLPPLSLSRSTLFPPSFPLSIGARKRKKRRRTSREEERNEEGKEEERKEEERKKKIKCCRDRTFIERRERKHKKNKE